MGLHKLQMLMLEEFLPSFFLLSQGDETHLKKMFLKSELVDLDKTQEMPGKLSYIPVQYLRNGKDDKYRGQQTQSLPHSTTNFSFFTG